MWPILLKLYLRNEETVILHKMFTVLEILVKQRVLVSNYGLQANRIHTC